MSNDKSHPPLPNVGPTDDHDTPTEILYDAHGDGGTYIPDGGIKIDSEIPADWPCQMFYFDRSNIDEPQYESVSARFRRLVWVALAVAVFVITSSLDSVLFTRLAKTLGASTLLLSEIIYPGAFVVVIWSMILIQKFVSIIRIASCGGGGGGGSNLGDNQHDENSYEGGDDDFDHRVNCCRLVNRRYLFIIMVIALGDTLSSLLMIAPIMFMDPILVMVLNQSIYIPINMLVARWYSGKRYRFPHYNGVGQILVSVVTLSLAMRGTTSGMNGISGKDLIWFLLIVLSKLPASFGQNYKEWHLKEKDMDVWCTTAWVALIQLLMSIPLLPTVLIPMPQYKNYNTPILVIANETIPSVAAGLGLNFTRTITSENMGSYIGFTFGCVFGDFTAKYPTSLVGNTNATIYDFVDSGIQCEGVGRAFLVFIIINVLFNVFQTNLLKLTTANVSAIITVLTVATANLAFSIQELSGVAYRVPGVWDFVALVGIGLGIANFWSVPEILPKSVLQDRESHGMAHDKDGDKDSLISKLRPLSSNNGKSSWCFGCFRKDRKFEQIVDLKTM